MSQVTQLPQTPNHRILRAIQQERELGEIIKYAALGAALDYVVAHHPEAQTPQEQCELAAELAKAALFQAAKALMDSPPAVVRQINV